jgi:uncharacterized protein (TIGR04551 family)
MGNHWGLGLAHNDGNGLDADYGDTVDRIMFTARLAGYYLIPMMDFVGKGPSVSVRGESLFTLGQPVDTSQQDDVTGPIAIPVLSFAVAKRDTDKELQQKLDKGEYSLNYGLYFSYRHQQLETVQETVTRDASGNVTGVSESANPTSINNTPGSSTQSVSIGRDATLYMPDLWARFQTKRLRLEAEVSGVFGTIGQRALTAAASGDPASNQSLSLAQVGAVLQGDYKLMDGNLTLGGEIGFASGDSAPGMGNRNILGGSPTKAGSIDGPQFNCSTLNCTDSSITNYRFNRDYRVDQILWREILGGVTDALYFKPTVKYRIAEGFNVFMSVIYSRTIFAASAPGGDNNLGVEFDPGVSYVSEDGFGAQLIYGGLVPLKGLSNPANNNNGGIEKDAGVAHSLRAQFSIKF